MMASMIFCLALGLFGPPAQAAQTVDPGRKAFETRCAACHGADGNGGEMGPPIGLRLSARDDQQLAELIRSGQPAKGMPPSQMGDAELADLVKHLRTIQRQAEANAPVVKRLQVRTTDGASLDGQVIGEGFDVAAVVTQPDRPRGRGRNSGASAVAPSAAASS